jgi:hypothetical protein
MFMANLQQAMRHELEVSRGMMSEGLEIVPRFIVFSPDAVYGIFVKLPDDRGERESRLRLIAGFMAWKMASSYVMAGEMPDAISAIAVARHEQKGLLRRVNRGPPLAFGRIETLGAEDIEEKWTALLPRRETSLSAETVRELEHVFGEEGEMPARRLS